MNVTTQTAADAPGATRRAMFGSTIAAAVVTAMGTAQTASPDAELIAIGREAVPLVEFYNASMVAFFALPPGHPGLRAAGAVGDAPYDRLEVLIEQATKLKARTPEGRAAKAHLLRHALMMDYGQGMEFVSECDGTALVWSLANDLIEEV